ncbi:DUF3108 domain-containing protein [Lysobacter sp. KIS68-7]|uniref:DUF3108 domain-containing protein n=1 Tax=Lysobacter sp. KIS68-7 TaxID=2904252 RepID=UPI001E58A64E|nr:DUF3108 domain-containing protein [Lysobacter sp. KIS68-7]UHQ19690.1 DUF3108 domain-containing protein [Lysobacter sp. KIS68-7]
MRRLFATLLLAAAVALPAFAAPSDLKPLEADYTARYMGMEGAGHISLAPSGGQWTYTLRISSSLATLSQSTTFDEKDGHWRPLSGTDAAAVLIKKSNKNAQYDWAKGEATWSGDVKPDRAGPVKLQPGDLDAMLLNLAIARDVNAGKPLHYRMVDDGRAKDLTYTVVGKEAINIGGKSKQATKVSRTDGRRETVLWIVDGLPVPARILQRKDGADEIDLQIKSMP